MGGRPPPNTPPKRARRVVGSCGAAAGHRSKCRPRPDSESIDMRTPVSYGFLVPEPEHFSVDSWVVHAAGVDHTDPEALPDWDYFTDVAVEARLVADVAAALAACGL